MILWERDILLLFKSGFLFATELFVDVGEYFIHLVGMKPRDSIVFLEPGYLLLGVNTGVAFYLLDSPR